MKTNFGLDSRPKLRELCNITNFLIFPLYEIKDTLQNLFLLLDGQTRQILITMLILILISLSRYVLI